MKIMMIGDVYGEPGRAALGKLLPRLRDQHQVDFTVVNVENAAGGFGVTQQIAESILEAAGSESPIRLVDFHCEATSESVAMGWWLDGKVSAVVGTHRHVQTADERVLPGGTAYITDLGMTGPTDGVIGVDRDQIVNRFLFQMPIRFETAKGPTALHGVVITVDPDTGRASAIERLRVPA